MSPRCLPIANCDFAPGKSPGSRAASGRSTPNSSHSDSSQSIPSFTFRGGHGRGGTSPANVLEDVPAAQLNSEEE